MKKKKWRVIRKKKRKRKRKKEKKEKGGESSLHTKKAPSR